MIPMKRGLTGSPITAKKRKDMAMESNVQKMRETLNNIGNAAAWVAENCNDQQKHMNVIIAMVQSALSAPQRNCDRFVDELDAQLAFLNEVWLISVDRETMLERDKFENWTDEMKTRYSRWLFATVERKGEGLIWRT